MEGMTRGELAREAAVNPETIRFYERRGLLPEPARTASGYRLYEPGDAVRLRFITRARDLGFTLEEVDELLSLGAAAHPDAGRVKERAERKIAEVQAKIHDLERMKATLRDLADACDGAGPAHECSLLHAFDR